MSYHIPTENTILDFMGGLQLASACMDFYLAYMRPAFPDMNVTTLKRSSKITKL